MKNLVLAALVIMALAIPAMAQETSPLPAPETQVVQPKPAPTLAEMENLSKQQQEYVSNLDFELKYFVRRANEMREQLDKAKQVLTQIQAEVAKLKAEPKPEDGKGGKKEKK